MAKKKDKSFSGKVIRGIRRELGRYWTDFESHVADLNTERRGMPLIILRREHRPFRGFSNGAHATCVSRGSRRAYRSGVRTSRPGACGR